MDGREVVEGLRYVPVLAAVLLGAVIGLLVGHGHAAAAAYSSTGTVHGGPAVAAPRTARAPGLRPPIATTTRRPPPASIPRPQPLAADLQLADLAPTYGTLLLILGAVTALVALVANARDNAFTPEAFGGPDGQTVQLTAAGTLLVEGKIASSPEGWRIQSTELKARGVNPITGPELLQALKSKGITIIDVRPRNRYAQGAIPGSINVPLFQPIEGFDPYRLSRRIQFALFNVEGTEYSPSFLSDLRAKVLPLKGRVVFLDDSGIATLSPSKAFPEGKAGHALIAAYLALVSGLRARVQYLEAGIIKYVDAGGELTDPTE